MDERHASLVDQAVRRLSSLGWDCRVEHTFAVYGERGSIDILAWLPNTRALLVIEVKTVIVDLQDLLSTLDRKRRLAIGLARELGWKPLLIGTLIVLPEERHARQAIADHPSLRSAYPAGNWRMSHWIRQPVADIRGIWFLRDSAGTAAKSKPRSRVRVRKPSSRTRARSARLDIGAKPEAKAVASLADDQSSLYFGPARVAQDYRPSEPITTAAA
jgi:hypothetical protein